MNQLYIFIIVIFIILLIITAYCFPNKEGIENNVKNVPVNMIAINNDASVDRIAQIISNIKLQIKDITEFNSILINNVDRLKQELNIVKRNDDAMNATIENAGSNAPRYNNLGELEKIIGSVIDSFGDISEFLDDNIKKYIGELKTRNYATTQLVVK
jgi:hypothetical protein